MKSTQKTILLMIGVLSLALGFIGIFTPLLPTTPFILLAGYCFSKSSERFHLWLLNHKFFGEIIRSWEQDRAIPVRAKILAILMLTISAAIMGFHPRISEGLKVFVLLFLFGIAAFILSRPNGGSAK